MWNETVVIIINGCERTFAIHNELSQICTKLRHKAKDSHDSSMHHPLRPCSYTFLSAVKQKLKEGDDTDSCWKEKLYGSYWNDTISDAISSCEDLKEDCRDISKEMDFVRPLKVPDVKILPKTLDHTSRDNGIPKEGTAATKHDSPLKDRTQERIDKSAKHSEKVHVQRRLDFCSTRGQSAIRSDEVEPLKAPNVSVLSNLSKKKDYVRDISREKENRSKRAKKDDAAAVKLDEVQKDQFATSRSPRRISGRENLDFPRAKSAGKTRNDRLALYDPRKESDLRLRRAKINDFATSTVRKDPDKRHRTCAVRSMSPTKDSSVECALEAYDDDSMCERTNKPTAKFETNDNESRNIIVPQDTEPKHKDDPNLTPHLSIDRNYARSSEVGRNNHRSKFSNYVEGMPMGPCHKEQHGKLPAKSIVFASDFDASRSPDSEAIDDVETVYDSNANTEDHGAYSAATSRRLKKTDLDSSVESSRDMRSLKSGEAFDDFGCSEDFRYSSTDECSKDNEEPYSRGVTTGQRGGGGGGTNGDTVNFNDTSLPEILLDPRRISFRDDNRKPEEFGALVTPDVNLTFKPKRKRLLPMERNSSEVVDITTRTNVPETNSEQKQEDDDDVPLLHPTALHMQFQAELHLLDSFDESLRQVMNVEKSLFDVNHRRDDNDTEKKNVSACNTDFTAEEHGKIAKEVSLSKEKATRNHRSAVDGHTDERHFGERRVARDNRDDDVPLSLYRNKVSDTKDDARTAALIKSGKTIVKVAEVQTQTVNDIATQTDTTHPGRSVTPERFSEIRGITFGRGSLAEGEVRQLSLESIDRYEDLERMEDNISLGSKMRTMSEISLHETTSSIKTETGTEISISTRDLTCSFNRYLDLEIAQLIKDEKERYDKIEMLFKSREKTLHDRTKKLVKLEEQKRALRDTGQDSRVSSVKKKQRALLLKLQQEKDEMNRLKELHKITSLERESMLQKQRNMFNPQISTKNILTKLKRSADNQSPRRLSGPMKGYDIRSNSSMSSLVDSDKSQHDRSQLDANACALDFRNIDLPKNGRDYNVSLPDYDKSMLKDVRSCDKYLPKSVVQDDTVAPKYEIKSRNFEEKMPKGDVSRLHPHRYDIDSKESSTESKGQQQQFPKERTVNPAELSSSKSNEATAYESFKSESDTLVEELTKKSKFSRVIDDHSRRNAATSRGGGGGPQLRTSDFIGEVAPAITDPSLKTTKPPQCPEEILEANLRNWMRSDKQGIIEKEPSGKKALHSADPKGSGSVKRKSSKCPKSKLQSNVTTEDTSRAKSTPHMSDDFNKPYGKRTKIEKQFAGLMNSYAGDGLSDILDLSEDQRSLEALLMHSNAVRQKNSKLLRDITDDYVVSNGPPLVAPHVSERDGINRENLRPRNNRNIHIAEDPADRSRRINACTVSRRSSDGSERSYSKSIVIREEIPDFKNSKKLKQILSARESALLSRKNCVEEWMTWHAKLREEENRVAKMEEAAMKLIGANSSILAYQDVTVSSDTSDVEGRIELLTEKLAERRVEMSRLKKEARKQAKQRLRALEANLLNQIKRYDTTIHEMRKKLEIKRGIDNNKDTDKAAIECKAPADFKVPAIALKRIRNIRRSGDLSRSKSEPDLSSTAKGRKKIGHSDLPIVTAYKFDDNDPHRSDLTTAIITDKTRADQLATVFVSNGRTSDASEMVEITEVSRGPSFPTTISHGFNEKTLSNFCHKGQQVDERMSAPPMHATVITMDDGEMRQIQAKHTDVVESGPESNVVILGRSPGNFEDPAPESDGGIHVVPDKLDFVRRNRNLNDDITCLENELKLLSDMMVRSSGSKSEDETATTTAGGAIRNTAINETKITPDVRPKSTGEANDRVVGENLSFLSNDNDSNDDAVVDPRREVDYEARGQEILNEIEKSIISEHIDMPENGNSVMSTTFATMIRGLRENEKNVTNDLSSSFSRRDDVPSPPHDTSKVAETNSAIRDCTARERHETTDTSDHHHRLTDVRNLDKEFAIDNDSAGFKETAEDVDASLKNEVTAGLESSVEESLHADQTESLGDIENTVGRSCESIRRNTENLTRETGITEEQELRGVSLREKEHSLYISPELDASDDDDDADLASTVNSKFDGNIAKTYDGHFDDVIAASNRTESTLMSEENDPSRKNDDTSLGGSFDIHPGMMCGKRTERHRTNGSKSNLVNFESGGGSAAVDHESRCPCDEAPSDCRACACGEDNPKDGSDVIVNPDHCRAKEDARSRHIFNVTDDSTTVTSALTGTNDTSRERIDHTPGEMAVTVRPANDGTMSREGTECRDSDPNSMFTGIPVSGVPSCDSTTENENGKKSCEKSEKTVVSLLWEMETVAEVDVMTDQRRDTDESSELACCRGRSKSASSSEVEECSDITPEQNDSGSSDHLEDLVETKEIISTDLTRISGERKNPAAETSKDLKYEDVSEESLGISEILDVSDSRTAPPAIQRLTSDKYQVVTRRSEEVVVCNRVLEDLSIRTSPTEYDTPRETENAEKAKYSEGLLTNGCSSLRDERREDSAKLDDVGEASLTVVVAVHESEELDSDKHERDTFSDASDRADTPPEGVSEINVDHSPLDLSYPRSDVEALRNGPLVDRNNAEKENVKAHDRAGYQEHRIVVDTSEKDIEIMIDKLKASLDQPGLEDAEFEAKLLRIKQLKIELEIKRLEAEEVSYYVREIPNKPPPPYTPPGGDRVPTTTTTSPADTLTTPPLAAVVPSNVEELTAFTEKATTMIYRAKQDGLNIAELEVPDELCESTLLGRETNETTWNNRRIYDTFLFDLCKEIIVEVYRSEHEAPGPSWTKPNVRTKPAIKIPRCLEDLNEYVGKEVATLFGFKTKLQRENMVMRWSRKRRDRVDELLAREAQAEEDEWTKFHYDELAVKNGLTVAILDTLLVETVDIIKVAYAKKRRTMMQR